NALRRNGEMGSGRRLAYVCVDIRKADREDDEPEGCESDCNTPHCKQRAAEVPPSPAPTLAARLPQNHKPGNDKSNARDDCELSRVVVARRDAVDEVVHPGRPDC